MAIEIRKIDTKGGLKKFVKWGIDLYKGNECFVPPLVMDDVKEVTTGYECGLSVAGYHDLQEGDRIASPAEVEVKKSL